MRLPIFSKRHKKAIRERTLIVKFDSATKQRILYTMEKFNEALILTDETGYNTYSSYLEEAGKEFLVQYGWPRLKAHMPNTQVMKPVGISDFIRYGAPPYIFDVIELFSGGLSDSKYSFQESLNEIFADSQLHWRLADDVIFHIDSEYMAEMLACASQLLATHGFEGAMQEFQKARSHIDSGDDKGTIHHANLALESTMKTILTIEKEKPGKLISRMKNSGIIPPYYDNFLDNFEQILRTVNIARNEESGHGQGAKIKEVPPHLAELVLNFCGALVIFLVKHHIDSMPPPPPPPEEQIMESDDDIPF